MRVLIAGSGYAGSLLAWFLNRSGVHVTICDKGQSNTSTSVSAGIMLPVTGRRLVKTYLADTVIPFAETTYKELEEYSGNNIYFKKDVLQLFSSVANRNEWFTRSSETDLDGYTGNIINSSGLSPLLKNKLGGIILKRSGYVLPEILRNSIKETKNDRITFITDQISSGEINISNSEVSWRDDTFDYLVFCEGYESIRNKWFRYIPFKPAKGEILDISAPGLNEDYIINDGIFILPSGNGIFRAGSTYDWDDLTELPTETGREKLSDNIREVLNCDFEITGHKAGIRPSVRDRRPVLGSHPVHRNLIVLNGLGTKGAMLAPWMAHLLAGYITSGNKIPREVNVSRFESLCQER